MAIAPARSTTKRQRSMGCASSTSNRPASSSPAMIRLPSTVAKMIATVAPRKP
jgi:hypothetical protein